MQIILWARKAAQIKDYMYFAIISFVLGILSLTTILPKAVPMIGLAFGICALIKEKKKVDMKKSLLIASVIGIIANGYVTVLLLIGVVH